MLEKTLGWNMVHAAFQENEYKTLQLQENWSNTIK